MADPEPVVRHRLFGRQKSHPLSGHQQMLIDDVQPELLLDLDQSAPTNLQDLFGQKVEHVWLEIGFGAGEHLAWQLNAHPNVGIIGCEPFLNGMAKLLARVPADQRPRLRLHNHDARDVLAWLPNGSLDRVFVLFPDPWPKKRHRKRRIVAEPLVSILADKLRSGSQLRFATDIDDYKRTGLFALLGSSDLTWQARTASDWRIRPDDWPGTRYEGKADREGRDSAFFMFERD